MEVPATQIQEVYLQVLEKRNNFEPFSYLWR